MKRAKRAAEMLEEQERQKQQAHLQRQQQREAAADRTVRDSLRDDNPNSISRKLRDCFDHVSADASLSIGCGEFAQAAALMGREFASRCHARVRLIWGRLNIVFGVQGLVDIRLHLDFAGSR
jgi:DNA gyrase/topoisomerase IV subunit B